MIRRTVQNKKLTAAQEKLLTHTKLVVYNELNFLWLHMRRKIKRLDRQRLSKAQLRKIDLSPDIWSVFKERLRGRLVKALLDGAILLYQLHAKNLTDQPMEFDTAAFARQAEPEIGTRITKIDAFLKRTVAHKVVGWYNSPGLTMQDIIDDLRPFFSLERAELIARTEITRLDDIVKTNLANQLGITNWWWMTMRDQLVCTRKLTGPDGQTYKGCRALHGKVFRMDQDGPPEGSHIGCVLPGQTIAIPHLEGAVQSVYKGDVVELGTLGGHNITVTPNHPILTNRGWVAADRIQKDDYVATHILPERVLKCIDPDNQDTPAVAEKIFESLKVNSGMVSRRVPTAPEYFNGDGRGINGETRRRATARVSVQPQLSGRHPPQKGV